MSEAAGRDLPIEPLGETALHTDRKTGVGNSSYPRFFA